MSTCKTLLLSLVVSLFTLISPMSAQASDDPWALESFLGFEWDAYEANSDAPNPYETILHAPIWDEFVDWTLDEYRWDTDHRFPDSTSN